MQQKIASSYPYPRGSPTSPPTSEPPVVEERRTSISFAVQDWFYSDYENLVAAFEQANPGIHVQLLSIDEIAGSEPESQWSAGTWRRIYSNADVVNLVADSQHVQQGLVYDLTPLVQADPHFQPDDFYMLEGGQWDGGLWFLPTELSFNLIVYDKQAFDEAGLPHPQPGWSWDDLLSYAQALTLREGDETTRWGFVLTYLSYPLHFIAGRINPLLDPSTDPPTPRLTQPDVVEALQWYADLYLKAGAAPYFDPTEETFARISAQVSALMVKERAAMWNQFHTSELEPGMSFVPYPVDAQAGPGSKTTLVHVRGLTMSAGTQQPAAAWRWMDYVSRQAWDGAGRSAPLLPARRSVAEASGLWGEIDQELAQALRYAAEHSYVPRWSPVHEAAAQALRDILAGKSVQLAADEAQAQAEAALQEDILQQSQATPAPAIVVAPPQEQQPSQEGVLSIVFTPGWCPNCYQAYRDVAQQFHETHPGILVEVKSAAPADMANIPTIARVVDCFQWYLGISSPEQQAAVLNLEPFLQADSALDMDDFYPLLLDVFTYQGQLWGLPSQYKPVVMEYNVDLFDAAGLDYPALDWTIVDFVRLALALTQGEGNEKQYGFVPDLFEYNILLDMLARAGAQFVDQNADPPALAFNTPATVEALQWYVSLHTELGVKPVFVTDMAELGASSSDDSSDDSFFELVHGERAAMWINVVLADALSLDELNTDIAPLPAGTASAGNAGASQGYFISSPAARNSSTADTQRACWQWITYLTAQPALFSGLPARRSVAESSAFRQRVGARRAAVYQASLADVERSSGIDILTSDSWLSHGLLWLGRAHDQAVKGQASVQEALQAAQELADDYRACVILKDAFDDRDKRLACLRQVDPSLPDILFGPVEDDSK